MAQTSSFITTLGSDTLVIEQFHIQPGKVEAEVLLRSPGTHLLRQDLLLDSDGGFKGFHSATFEANMLDGPPVEEQTAIVVEDSLLITHRIDTIERRMAFAYDPGLLPWFDMVHWPYEVATRQMVAQGEKDRDQKMLAGRNPAVFEIRTLASDSVSIKHPFRGTMYAKLDKEGAITYYDATATTRKLIVRRGGEVQMDSLAAVYAEKPVGNLSGEGETQAEVHGANILITFGQPAQRGRELFGGIVPWGQRWRTGANRATHFRTDKALKFQNLDMPAGEYTLFTIPEPEGGTLIINKQTGQNGNNYDASHDLGRVPMTLHSADTSEELFTIEAAENGEQALLQLKWGTSVFQVPFEVVK